MVKKVFVPASIELTTLLTCPFPRATTKVSDSLVRIISRLLVNTGDLRVSHVHYYKFQLDDGKAYPDPASRYQPEGPHGPSQIIDASAYPWSTEESSWPGRSIEGQVLYELHVGTFTPEGSYEAAERELSRLAEFGITVLEIMPLGQLRADGVGDMTESICLPHITPTARPTSCGTSSIWRIAKVSQ
jgi:hypothetical protein